MVYGSFLEKCFYSFQREALRRRWPSGRALAGAGYNTLQASIQESAAWSLSLTPNAAAPGAPLDTPGCTHTAQRGRSGKGRNVTAPKINKSVTSSVLCSRQVTNHIFSWSSCRTAVSSCFKAWKFVQIKSTQQSTLCFYFSEIPWYEALDRLRRVGCRGISPFS